MDGWKIYEYMAFPFEAWPILRCDVNFSECTMFSKFFSLILAPYIWKRSLWTSRCYGPRPVTEVFKRLYLPMLVWCVRFIRHRPRKIYHENGKCIELVFLYETQPQTFSVAMLIYWRVAPFQRCRACQQNEENSDNKGWIMRAWFFRDINQFFLLSYNWLQL